MNQPAQAGAAPSDVEKPMWGIGAISYAIAWVEQLITTISAPLLTFVAVLTVASAFQGGALIQGSPFLTQAYSWSLGIGIEGQLAAMAYNARRAAVNAHGGQAIFYWMVTVILYIIGVLTGGVVAYQEAFHTNFDAALQAVGVPLWIWDWGRVVIMFGLIVLSAATRYVKPAPQVSVEVELARIDREAKIASAKRKAAAERLAGIGGIVRGGIAAARGQELPADVQDIAPEEAPVFAEQSTQELPVIATSEPAKLDLGNFKGSWWDAPRYRAYINFRYGVGITQEKAIEVVREVGNNARAPGKAGAPYIAGIQRLKAYAKRTYGAGNAASVAPEMVGQFSE